MKSQLRLRRRRPAHRARRGIALFISMFFVAGIGALALSAIYLTANATLISKSYEKEDDLKYAAEAALAIGKASLNFNPAALPDTGFVSLMQDKPVLAADGNYVPNVKVNMWLGPTGMKNGQYGRFASLVAEARDAGGAGFVRRLELTQESFAKFAYWSNSETNSGSTIYFASGDQLWGPVWSNDDISIHSTGATFHDVVGTARTIAGEGYGTFKRGYSENQKPIKLPSLDKLSMLSGLAGVGGMSFTATTTGDETTVRKRIEFVAADMNGNSDSTEVNEGFFRVYSVPSSAGVSWLRADWPGASSVSAVINCGDWHLTPLDTLPKFFPASIHPTSWFRQLVQNGGMTNAAARAESAATVSTILGHAGARCYLGGDPHLVAIARTGVAGQKGGEDSTITMGVDAKGGSWAIADATPDNNIQARRPWDASLLYPLHRGFNTSTKGVVYVGGTVGISGVVNSRITLYSPNTIVVLDDLRYANDPALSTCHDVLGIIAGDNVVVADNSLNTPEYTKTGGAPVIRSLDDTPDTYIHAVIMALKTSFTAENYDQGPTNSGTCQGKANGRGCLYLTGGLIQANRGPVGLTSGAGFIKRYSYDRCAATNPPPYFPTTGRFQDNRYYELDPIRFKVVQLFEGLKPNS